MAHGLRVYAADGTIQLDTTERLARVLYDAMLPAGVAGSVVLPEFEPARGAYFVLADYQEDRTWYAPRISWNNLTKTMSWTAGSLPCHLLVILNR